MKKFILLPIVIVILSLVQFSDTKAQVLDGVYVKEHVPSRKPIPYTFLREADVMWGKRIWRILDLREKINHPLYFPTKPIGDRMSLIELLLWGISHEGLTAYDAIDDRFKIPMTKEQIDDAFGVEERTQTITDPETGEQVEQVVPGEITSEEIKQYMLKEDWFFNRQLSSMEVRIIGICPIRHYYREEDIEQLDVQKRQVFWIYFPEARRILANHEVFNPYNDAERKTFDDIFFKRRFNSFVARESNVYDDRSINEYKLGIEALLEAQRVKENMFNYEQDLWEY